jgi:hypothetical protein
MKKMFILFGLISTMLLSGCSFLGEVNNSLDYANEATAYLDKAKKFAEDVPQLAQDAVTNQEARKNLENELKTMKQDIKEFNETKAPSIAEDIHNQIVEYNQKLDQGIDIYLNNIENGQYDPAFLEDTEIMQTINELRDLSTQIEKLGS